MNNTLSVANEFVDLDAIAANPFADVRWDGLVKVVERLTPRARPAISR